jgi:3-oxoacyl-[acyl-carrier-protein] synthase III
MVGPCPVFLQAIWTATSLMKSRGLARALVVYGETCSGRQRCFGRIAEHRPRDFFSDGAGAVLLDRTSSLTVASYGDAENGEYWDYFSDSNADRFDLAATRDSLILGRKALQQCLDHAGWSINEVDTFLLPNEVETLNTFLTRRLHIPAARVFRALNVVSHAWGVDPIANLQTLLSQAPLAPGARIVCSSRALGSSAFLGLRVAQG